jgi:predicted regulator of Ras-like GTPase activity (Roadblock/LC7/MglB family)
MSDLAADIRQKLMHVLKEEEDKTDLSNLAVLSTVGLKVASSTSMDLDADPISASSTALIDLGLRLSEATHHGALMEILLHNSAGYSILMAINDEYIVFGGLGAVFRIGYYLGYLQELAKKLSLIISGSEVTKKALTKQEKEIQKVSAQKAEEEAKKGATVIPSVEEDKAAMTEMLGYLEDWDNEEKEAMGIEDFEDLETDNIVSIPKSMIVGMASGDETVSIQEEKLQAIKQKDKSEFKLYRGEVPPVPLDDYTPMDVEEKAAPTTEYEPVEVSKPVPEPPTQELPPLDQLPSFDQLKPPDFESEFSAAEYDIDFVLEEESVALDSVLKDLGWDEED